MAQLPENTGTVLSGTKRWVQFAFVALFVTMFWFFDHLFARVGSFVAEKANIADFEPFYVSIVAGLLSLGIAVFLYRKPNVNRFAMDVAYELERVTWPTKDETWNNTLIVMAVSAVSAVILGVFDYSWSNLTSFIYQ